MSKISPLTVADSYLIDEWDHTKNTLLPKNLTIGSKKEAWWLCKNGHSWLAKIHRKTKCPYCESRLPCEDNCLSFTHPELASEWHPTKNGHLKPANFTVRAGKKVWWQCKKERIHEWEAAINTRCRGEGCPYCIGKRVSITNSLSSIKPLIAMEFHPNKNGTSTPDDFTWGSNKKVWWLCKENKQHEWEATIGNRTGSLSKCPYCANKKVDVTNCLAKTHTELAKEWHSTLNKNLTPYDFTYGSQAKIFWLCPKGHNYRSPILSRAYGTKCSYCDGKKVNEENSLATAIIKNKELAHLVGEWHPIKNGKLKPTDFTKRSSKTKIWWTCSRNPAHEWQASIASRTGSDNRKGTGCPHCHPSASEAEYRLAAELEVIFPSIKHKAKIQGKEADILIDEDGFKLIIELDGAHFHMNKEEKDRKKNLVFKKASYHVLRCRSYKLIKGKKLDKISEHDFYFDCGNLQLKDVKEILLHIKKTFEDFLPPMHGVKIDNYLKRDTYANEAGFNKSFRTMPIKSDFGTLKEYSPNLASQWHPTKNNSLPEHYSAKSGQKVWWVCHKDKRHEWQAKICSRVNGVGLCPFCFNRKVDEKNCLAAISPKLASEWHPDKNGILTPEQVVAGSKKTVWWQCFKDRSHEWQTSVDTRIRGRTGCPFCSKRSVHSTNCLANTNPALALEWHPTKNDDLTPNNIVAGSKKLVWWLCKENKQHEWEATVGSRHSGNKCPYCSNRKVDRTNCLSFTHPELASEWHPTKNCSLTSDDFTYGSKKKAWWQCPIHPNHIYCSTILSRSSGHGCPECARKIKSITAHKRWERERIAKIASSKVS